MKKTLEMVFTDSVGNDVTVTMVDPKDNLTMANVRTAMEDIITRNIFTSKGGGLVAIKDAQIRVYDTIELA